ncbi:MAG: ribosomal L7Ae/L30e/S12e/Gadd45 family protein [Nitrososphaeraceae archaeon]
MKALEKLIKEAVASGKYKKGAKEVMKFVKGSKLILVSDSVSDGNSGNIEDQAKSMGIPVLKFPGTSVALGRACNRPHRISVLSIRTGTEEEIRNILSEKVN